MRVLITTPSAWGHLQPMAPLALALQRHGHEVRWATGADSAAWITARGIKVIAAGVPQSDLLSALAGVRQRYPQLSPEDLPDAAYADIFASLAAPAMLRDLLPVVADWSPDLVLNDPTELAGPIVAARLGVPNVTKSFGVLFPAVRIRRGAEAAAPLWESVGLEPPTYAGFYDHLYLDICPPELQPELSAYVPKWQLLRPLSEDTSPPVAAGPGDTAGLPADWPSDFPAAYLTMGTVFADPARLRAVIEAVARLDVGTLVTVGPRVDPTLLALQPRHIRIERYVPQSQVLDRCRVVVSHTGSGTALAALSRGVPQVCLPQGADQFLNAWAIEAAGAGLYLHPSAANPESIAAAVGRVLAEPHFNRRAAAVAKSIAAMPTPDEVVPILEALGR